MNIKEERKAFEESNNVNPDWSFNFNEELQQYVALDHEMQLQVDEFNEHWDIWRAAWQASANREGFVLVPKEPTVEICKQLSSNLDNAKLIYKAMIEAQEQSNESN